MIDVQDMDNVLNNKWYLSGTGYAVSKGGQIHLPALILGHKKNHLTVVDHINQNKLDNRRCNLRIVDKSLNAFNTKMRTDNISGHRGVSWDKEKNKWCARITIHGKQKQIGRYDNIEDAILARKTAERGIN